MPSVNPRLLVRTVDSFQGNEADLVIINLVRNNPFGNPNNAWGFLLNPERLNVMFSRARRHLIVVGCSSMINLYSAYEEVKPLVSIFDYFRLNGVIMKTSDFGVLLF
jgi:superfamily I DNA and/or RNA helicase